MSVPFDPKNRIIYIRNQRIKIKRAGEVNMLWIFNRNKYHRTPSKHVNVVVCCCLHCIVYPFNSIELLAFYYIFM